MYNLTNIVKPGAFKETILDIREFYRRNRWLFWIFTLPFGCAIAIALKETRGTVTVVSVISLWMVWLALADFQAQRWQSLTARINDPAGQHVYWSVDVNWVRVGRLNDAEIAQITRDVNYDLLNIWDDNVALLSHWFKTIPAMLTAMPVIAFWVCAVGLLVAPAEFMQAVEQVRNAALAGGVVVDLALPLFILGVTVIYASIFAFLHVIQRPHSHRIATIIRQRLQCPTEGHMVILKHGQGYIYEKEIQLT